MKKNKIVTVLLLVIGFLSINSCKKEMNETSLSSIFSLPITINNPFLANYCVDNTQQFLYLFIRDFTNGNTLINKIDIAKLTTVKQITIDNTVPIMAGNILVTSKNEIVTSFYNFATSSQLLLKFDVDLNILVNKNVANVLLGNQGRMRITQNAPGIITGCQSNSNDIPNLENWFLRWVTMDENLNVLSEKIDSGSSTFYYGRAIIAGQGLIKTSDGGFLYSGYNVDTPLYISQPLIEKRDANLNLLWRKIYQTAGGSGNTSGVNEVNGNYYIYCVGTDTAISQDKLFVLQYDKNGNLLADKQISNGATITKGNEPMILNSKGNFFMLAQTKLGASPGNNKGALFTTDANLNILNSTTFGGIGNVASSGMIKLNDNKYMLLYLDNSFTPDGNNSRLVIRYIDADGNFIE